MAGQFQRKPQKREKKPAPAPSHQNAEPLNHMHQQLVQWHKTVRFRKKLFGGVDEADLWKKLADLYALYDKALTAERARYDALLQAQAPKPEDPEDPGEWEGSW